MLAWALRHERAALTADFQRVYGLDIEGLYSGEISVLRAARLTAKLPRGSQLWRALGGAMAVTDEWDLLNAIEHNIRAMPWAFSDSKERGKAPEPMPYPEINEKYAQASGTKRQRQSSEDYVTEKALARRKQLQEARESKG